MSRTRVHWGRVLFAVALLGASVAMQVYSARVDAQVPDDSAGVTVSGGGEDIEAAVDVWSGALGGGAMVDAGRTGSLTGRTNLAEGNADFSVSSLPFSPSDLTALQQRGATAIEAPLAVTGMAFTYGTRTGAPMEQAAEDPFVNPETPFSFVDRPIRIPAGVIARTMLNVQTQPLERDPDFTEVFAPNFLVPQSDRPFGVVRSDSDASNRHLLEFVKRNADKVTLPDVPALNPIAPAESFPIGYGTSFKQGEDQLEGGLLNRKVDTAGGGSIVPMIVGMSPSRTNRALLKSAQNNASNEDGVTKSALYPIAVKNGLGQWVTATSESLTKAAAGAVAAAGAGRPAPLWGLAETAPDVDGAYPVSWIVNIQLPTSGLSPEKTTALATFLRYATSETGQTAAVGAGYGRLPNPLVLQAAVAADQLVTSNCTGADRKLVVAGDGGPYWPAGVAVPAGGFKVCEAIPSATTTTDAPTGNRGANGASNSSSPNRSTASSGSGFSSRSSSSSSFSPGGSSLDSSFDVAGASEFADDGSQSGAADGGGPEDTLDAAAVSATLPLPLPDDGRTTLDRLATMVLGGAAFLLLRSAFRARTVPS